MAEKVNISFGTSGWRAVIADEFTFENVCLVSRAIAGYLKSKNKKPKVMVGYDTRFLSDIFAVRCSEALLAAGVEVLLSERDVPTPVIAYQVQNRGLDGAVNFTASHNPPEYNGIKFSPAYGGPAPSEVTRDIEARIKKLQSGRTASVKSNGEKVRKFDPAPEYLKRIGEIIDLRKIKKAGLRVGVDCIYGTSRGYLDGIMTPLCQRIEVFHDYLNPLFGGHPPEPSREYLTELTSLVKREKFDLGLACDGDADRFGIVDAGGKFLNPNEVFSLVFYYLLKTRGKTAAKVARSVATTHMIDAIAEKEGMTVLETPVGFKYIGEALDKGDCLIGGEESGGLSIQNHVPEKDGILACLLMAEMAAEEKRPLSRVLTQLYKTYGYFYSDRINLHMPIAKREALLRELKGMQEARRFCGITVSKTDFRDGFKFVFSQNHWIMLRPSGTEPLVRCYFEAGSKAGLGRLKDCLKAFLRKKAKLEIDF